LDSEGEEVMTVEDEMKKIAFTPDDLADVYAKRWMIRDMGNYFISHLKPVGHAALIGRSQRPRLPRKNCRISIYEQSRRHR
jgi:hypothetical protein